MKPWLALRLFRSSSRFCSTVTGSTVPEKWNLVSSICVQRKPVITKEMTSMEKKMANLLSTIDIQLSLKSEWELKNEEEKKLMGKKEKDEQVVVKSCRDWEDEWKSELKNTVLAPCHTEADTDLDSKTLDRLLDSTLLLVVKQAGNGDRWILPQGVRADGETMRQTAERILQDRCGEKLKVRFYGNAPCGFFKYKYPRAQREKLGFVGDKVFFFKAELLGGELKSGDRVENFRWVGRNELKKTLEMDYCRSVERFLIDENAE